jgi:hypothetical protein
VRPAPAFELADVVRRHGGSYARENADHLGRVERRVLAAIAACRTAALGGHVERCDDCGLLRLAYNSCRNRHCPKCQGAARAQWLVDREAEFADSCRSRPPKRDDVARCNGMMPPGITR